MPASNGLGMHPLDVAATRSQPELLLSSVQASTICLSAAYSVVVHCVVEGTHPVIQV